MNTRRLEQLVIAILLILDLCLLFVVAADRIQTRRDQDGLRDQLAALLEENGIRADKLKLPETPPVCRLLRDAAAEQQQMKTLLGAERSEDQGGGIRFYRGSRGQAILRGTGELELLFQGETLRAAERLFAGADLPLVETDRYPEDPNTLLRYCLWDGIPILNTLLKLDFNGETVSLVTGAIPFQKETERSSEGVMSAATALVRFLELMQSEGIVSSRLEEISPVYWMSVPVAGESTLTPLWRIRTDTGVFYLNAVSGRMETVN